MINNYANILNAYVRKNKNNICQLKHVQDVIHSIQVTKNSKFQAVELKDLNKNMVLKTNFWKIRQVERPAFCISTKKP